MEFSDALEAEKLTKKSVNSIAGHPVVLMEGGNEDDSKDLEDRKPQEQRKRSKKDKGTTNGDQSLPPPPPATPQCPPVGDQPNRLVSRDGC